MKKGSIYIVLGIITILFATICLLVWLTRGKNGYLIRKKLILGGLLLNLGNFTSGCGDERIVTCYAPAPENYINLYMEDHAKWPNEEDPLVLSENNTIFGQIDGRINTHYFFVVEDDNTEWQKEELEASDGAFDESMEFFTITLREDLPTGNYRIAIWGGNNDDIEQARDLHAEYISVIGTE